MSTTTSFRTLVVALALAVAASLGAIALADHSPSAGPVEGLAAPSGPNGGSQWTDPGTGSQWTGPSTGSQWTGPGTGSQWTTLGT